MKSVKWSAWDIPGWRDDPRLRAFYKHCLGVESIDDIAEQKSAATDGGDYSGRLRASLEYLLEQQPASTKAWYALTGLQFFSESELYGYLLDLYEYFYGDRADPPQAPDPDRAPPADDDRFWQPLTYREQP